MFFGFCFATDTALTKLIKLNKKMELIVKSALSLYTVCNFYGAVMNVIMGQFVFYIINHFQLLVEW